MTPQVVPFPKTTDKLWAEATAVATDSKDRVYVFAREPHRVLVFERDGTLVKTWGEGTFRRPHGITIGPDDSLYLSDDAGQTVSKYTADGRCLMTLGTPDKPSDTGVVGNDYRTIKQAAGPFNYPTNVAIAADGTLFITDGYGNARVHVFTADGKFVRSWGEPGSKPGQFNLPHGIAVDREGIVYVADRENSRIQLFTREGKYLSAWTELARPCQIFIGRDNLAYVAELGFRAGRWSGMEPAEGKPGGRCSIFDLKGKLLTRWGGGDNPCAPGDFFAPHDIRVDSEGSIYVAEVSMSAGGNKGVVPADCHSLQKFRTK